MKPFDRTSCVILSAGNSFRMAGHKALLKFDDDMTFIGRITETYLNSGVEQVIVVVSSKLSDQLKERKINLPERVSLVINDKPESGRFYSLQTGAKHLKVGNYSFFQNIDNPFTSAELLKALIHHKDEADVIIPAFHERSGHPVLLSPEVACRICLEGEPDLRIDEFLKRFKVKMVETSDKRILVNINSPDEYLAAGFHL